MFTTETKKVRILEEQERQVAQLQQNPALMEADLDVYPLSISPAQFESLIILLSTKSRMTTKALQRAIEYATIFNFLNSILADVNERASKQYESLLKTYDRKRTSLEEVQEAISSKMIMAKEKLIADVIQERSVKNPILKAEVYKYIGDLMPHKSFFAVNYGGFKAFMLSKDEYGNAEKKRAGVIREIRKLSNLNVPSYNIIAAGLEELEEHGYIANTSAKELKEAQEELRAGAKGAWHITPLFNAIWSKKRLNILREYDTLYKKLHDPIRAIYQLKENYGGVKLLDFYLVKVNERRAYTSLISSQYLTFQEEVSTVFRE